jgi:hypothetical protein
MPHRQKPRSDEHDVYHLINEIKEHLNEMEKRAASTTVTVALIGAIGSVLTAYVGHEPQPKPAPPPPAVISEPYRAPSQTLPVPRVEPKAGAAPEIEQLVYDLSGSAVKRSAFATSVQLALGSQNKNIGWQTFANSFMLHDPAAPVNDRAWGALCLGAIGATDKTTELRTMADEGGVLGEAAAVALKMLGEQPYTEEFKVPTLKL